LINRLRRVLSDKKIRACLQCAACSGCCPSARASPFRIRKLIRQIQLGSSGSFLKNDLSWLCVMCYKCLERCPKDVNIPYVVCALRDLAIRKGVAPKNVVALKENIDAYGNPYGLDNSLRWDWVNYTGAKVKVEGGGAETVYFVGCLSSYMGRLQEIPYAISLILDKAGEDWTFLNEELCCGHPLLLAGFINEFKELAAHNVKAVEDIEAKRLVTGCPGCTVAFRKEYPEILGRKLSFEVLHLSELLNRYVKQRRIRLRRFIGRVTYHDPCELGRLLNVFEDPRIVLKGFVSRFVECRESLTNSNCCGAGGLVKLSDPQLSDSLAKMRLGELIDTGAEVCVTACPACKLNLSEAALELGGIQIMDLSELVSQQLSR